MITDASLVINNIKNNKFLYISITAFLALFISKSVLSIVTVSVTCLIIIASLSLYNSEPVKTSKPTNLLSITISALIIVTGFMAFKSNWLQNEYSALHTVTVIIIDLMLCAIGLVSVYKFFCWFFYKGKQLIPAILVTLSALAFFCINITATDGYHAGILIGTVLVFIVCVKTNFLSDIKNQNFILKVIAILSASGICWGSSEFFYFMWWFVPEELNISFDITFVAAIVLFGLSLLFVYDCILWFWIKFSKIFKELNLFSDFKYSEYFLYIFLTVLSVCFSVYMFSKSKAFYDLYEKDIFYDVIYTSDSFGLLKTNAYLCVTHEQNDIRQPLFAVFSAPFISIPYFIGRMFEASYKVQAILISSTQIIVLMLTNLILAKMLKLNSYKRAMFMIGISCLYTYLLSCIMIEQYIFAYFWLILCLYFICENNNSNSLVLWAAAGTLLTNGILFLFNSSASIFKNMKKWLTDTFKLCAGFALLIIFFCRFDVIYYFMHRLSFLCNFTGADVPFLNRVQQYTAFVANCFFAPDAGTSFEFSSFPSWQLKPITSLNYFGIVILCIAFISFLINRNKKISRISGYWILYSVVILLFMGWGTKENGLILYSLCFGWPFFVLIFQLAEFIDNKLNKKIFIPVLVISLVAVLVFINIPGMMDLLKFAATYYPI